MNEELVRHFDEPHLAIENERKAAVTHAVQRKCLACKNEPHSGTVVIL